MAKSYEQDFPSLQWPELRLALLIVDAALAGNSRLLPDGEACTCGVGDDVDVIVDGNVRVPVHRAGCAGSPDNSPALRPAEPIAEWHDRYRDELTAFPILRQLLIEKPKEGVDAIYDWADLKTAEATALAMHHAGFQLGPIAKLLSRQESAVRQLILNGVWKLERALRMMAPVDGEPHCEICRDARAISVQAGIQARRMA